MGQQQDKLGKVDVAALWKKESKLSAEERRKRYKCGGKFVTADKLAPWSQDVDKVLKDGECA